MFEKQGMNKKEIKVFLEDSMKDAVEWIDDDGDDDGNKYNSVYIGSFMSLDPCGKYHHMISPNGITKRCEQFWDSIEKVAGDLGGSIVAGEGNATDIYFVFK